MSAAELRDELQMGFWGLDENKVPYPIKGIEAWGENRMVQNRMASTQVTSKVWVSTVFLGMDHGWGRGGGPVLFETMIFGGQEDGYQERYRTYTECLEGHKRAVELAERRMWQRMRKRKKATARIQASVIPWAA